MYRDVGQKLSSMSGYYTSRKQGFRSEVLRAIVPIDLRIGTNVSFSPGSSGEYAQGGTATSSPDSDGTFSPGWRHQLGLKGLRRGAAGREPL
jgi:hypothetical protein